MQRQPLPDRQRLGMLPDGRAVVKMDQLIAAQWTASEQPWVFPGMDLFSYQRIASLAMLVLGNVKQPKKTNHMEIPNALKQNNLDFAIGR